jgi:predicted nucleotidyltransferase
MTPNLDTLRREKRGEILRLAGKYGGHSVRVFGSVARGEAGPESDIDFPVEFEAGRTLFDLIGLRLDLQELLGSPVDVVTPNSLRYLREQVVGEAREL